MNNRLEKAKTWSELVKNFTQILAIIIGGIWTYNLFIQQDAPILEPRASAGGSLTWKTVENGDDCEALFRTSLTNIGTTSFDVTRVQVRGWKFQREKSDEFATYLDIHEIQSKADLFFDKIYSDDSSTSDNIMRPFFIERFPPDHEYNNTFSWITSPEPNLWVLFHVQFVAESNGKEYSWQTYSWGTVDCFD